MILKEVYDYESFKEGQEEIIEKFLKTKPVWGYYLLEEESHYVFS